MNRLVKLLSLALCVMIVICTALTTTFALTVKDYDNIEKNNVATDNEAQKEAQIFKDESVYVIASATGEVQKIIVSDWIKNNAENKTITDVSSLDNIENVKGDETFELNKDDMRVWNTSDGEDLYLQGTSKNALPVDVAVSFTLDSKSIAPENLKGKSGKVTIRFDYTNNQYEYVEIDGKKEKIYVPFFMLTGMILDNTKFKNIEVSNGKLINDGDKTMVAGIAFPGLQHNLDISKNDYEIPNYIKIEADVENFELSSTVTIATNGLFNEIEDDKFDSIDKLSESLDEMDSAMNKLTDGSSQLYDGLSTLLEKSNELTKGVDKLSQGASQLKDGASDINIGSIQINSGMLDLSNGLGQIASNNSKLTSGSEKVFDSILSTADEKLKEAGLTVPKLSISNYQSVLLSVIASLDENTIRAQAKATAKEKVAAAIEAQRDTIVQGVTAVVKQTVTENVTTAVQSEVRAEVLAAAGFNDETYNQAVTAGIVDDAVQDQINGAISSQMQSDEIQNSISEKVAENMQSDAVKDLIEQNTQAKIDSLIEENMKSKEVQTQIEEGIEKAKTGQQSVTTLLKQLNEYNTFYNGVSDYTSGVASAGYGASTLKGYTSQLANGTSDLSNGASQLYDGILTLKNGTPSLISGVSKLKDGSMQLSNGLKKFNNEGIQKIISAANKASTVATRLKATVNVSKDYKSYSGTPNGMDGEVKFIYKTESIE